MEQLICRAVVSDQDRRRDRRPQCPRCTARIETPYSRFALLRCDACVCFLSLGDPFWVNIATIATAAALATLLGARGAHLFAGTVDLVIPVYLLIISPALRATGTLRLKLYDGQKLKAWMNPLEPKDDVRWSEWRGRASGGLMKPPLWFGKRIHCPRCGTEVVGRRPSGPFLCRECGQELIWNSDLVNLSLVIADIALSYIFAQLVGSIGVWLFLTSAAFVIVPGALLFPLYDAFFATCKPYS